MIVEHNPINDDIDTTLLDTKIEIVEHILEDHKFEYDKRSYVWRRQDNTVSILITITTDIDEQKVWLEYNIVVDVDFDYTELLAYMEDMEKDMDDAKDIIEQLEDEIKEKLYYYEN